VGELQRKIEQLSSQESERDRRIREMRERSSQRSQEFIDAVRGVGKTALYECKSIKYQGPPTGYRRSRNAVRNEFHFAGEGWVVTQRHSEGRDTHLIVLDTNDTYRCNLPGLYAEEKNGTARMDRTPYVTTYNLPASLEPTVFSFEHELEALAQAVLRLTGEGQGT
jgi:hypothetical protein